MPGSHRFWLGERFTTRGAGPVSLMPPVDAARREAGGIDDNSPPASGARAVAWSVVSCTASMAFVGDGTIVAFDLAVTDESTACAAFLDDDRTR